MPYTSLIIFVIFELFPLGPPFRRFPFASLPHRKAAAEPRPRDPNRRLACRRIGRSVLWQQQQQQRQQQQQQQQEQEEHCRFRYFRFQFLFQCSFFQVKTNLKHHQVLVQDYHLAQPIISLIQNLQTYCKTFTNPDPARIKFWRRKSLILSQWTLKKKFELYFPY